MQSTSPSGKVSSWFMEFAKAYEVYVAPASNIRDQWGDKFKAVVLINPARYTTGFPAIFTPCSNAC